MFTLKSIRRSAIVAAISALVSLGATAAQADVFRGAGALYNFSGCEAIHGGTTSLVNAIFDASTVDGEPSRLSLYHLTGSGVNLVMRQPLERSNTWTRTPGTVMNETLTQMRPVPRTYPSFLDPAAPARGIG
ncbi:hypothetical protein LCM17_05055 [Cereibacter sphaeroides]|nr:hypothetical protein [Cereibacter sphaeroides]